VPFLDRKFGFFTPVKEYDVDSDEDDDSADQEEEKC